MKKYTKISMIVLITTLLLLTVTMTGLAKKPTEFTLNYDMDDINWATNYGTGTFESEGAIEMDGNATLIWNPAIWGWQGTMFFDDGGGNSITARITIMWEGDPGDGCRYGHFYLYTPRNEGEYAGYRGNGTLSMCGEVGVDIFGTLTGVAIKPNYLP